jgi:bacterioferritin
VQAREGVVDLLNRHLTVELTAINQYFLAAEMCRNWGYEGLYQKFRSLSMEEMEDAEKLVRHILYLEGLPNMQRLNEVRVSESVPEVFQSGLEAEMNAVAGLREAIAHCANVGDFTSRAMLEEMIREEEEHVDWFETQIETVRQVGLERYLIPFIRS